MRTLVTLATFFLVLSLFLSQAFSETTKTFVGRVKAIDPQGKAIVVTQGEGKSEMVVGAIITPETEVIVKGKPASLADIKVGDEVTLIYIRTHDLYAKKIVKK